MTVDVSWVVTGSAVQYKVHEVDQWVTARDAPAHLTGTVLVDGVPWTTDRASGTLRSGTWKTF